MLKFHFLVLFVVIGLFSNAQQIDTIVISQAEKLIAMQFTAAEKDSMQQELITSRQHYDKMHKVSIPNALPFPFAFEPALAGGRRTVKANQAEAIKFDKNIELPASQDAIAYYSIQQLASLIRAKKISSVALTQFFLNRLKKWGDTLECVITRTDSLAMAQAKQADEEIQRGIYRGLLHGIPYGLKDLFAVKGYKTTWGSVPYKDQVIEEDAFVYQQLRKAGAVLCAKLTLGELAFSDLWFGGRTRNPWNLQYGSSGSSAGSAAATVAGLLPFAIGTETLGSIVSPSHTCGATGLRPTFGSVSRTGAMVLSWSLDKVGPICRSAADAAIVFKYIAGTDGRDPSAVERNDFNFYPRDIAKMKIAVAANYFKSLPKNAPQWAVLDTLKKLGAHLEEVDFPDTVSYPFNMVDIILSAECAAAFDELTRSNSDDLIRRQDKNFWPNNFRSSRFIPAVEYINANRHRFTLMQTVQTFMKSYDVVISPTYAGNQLAITNLTGNPVVCLPIGFSNNGLPTSITFIGNLYDENSILSLAKMYQDATATNKLHPPKFSKN